MQHFGDIVEYAKLHKLERRCATLDEKYMVIVANKAFTEYFGYENGFRLMDYVHPDEIEELKVFLETYDGQKKERVFRMRFRDGSYRNNILKIGLEKKMKDALYNAEIELVDIDSLEFLNEGLVSNVNRLRRLMGMTQEYAFSYSEKDNIIHIFRYEQYQKVTIYKQNIDEWAKEVLDNGYVAEKDISVFLNMIEEIKAYEQSFVTKLESSIRTRSGEMESLSVYGSVFIDSFSGRIVIGRIIPEDVASKHFSIGMEDELNYDSLTKVYNKKAITEYAKQAMKEVSNNWVTVVILDVDHFKTVNDTYGHLYGDKVLTRVGYKLKEIVGDSGVVGRIGGDEFMLVIDTINDEQILRSMLRAIRTQIKWEFVSDFEGFTVSCSIGAAYEPNNRDSYEELFKKADFCLYVAKEKGRDRYVFFRDHIHRQAYEESQNKKEKNVANNSRELKVLGAVAEFMKEVIFDRDMAYRNILEYMFNTYKLDSINIYMGPELKKVYTMGETIENASDAMYAKGDEFKRLLGGRICMNFDHISKCLEDAPEFCRLMGERKIFSSMQCIIGTPDNIMGLITFDKNKELSQWAEYEINSAVILASYMGDDVLLGRNIIPKDVW